MLRKNNGSDVLFGTEDEEELVAEVVLVVIVEEEEVEDDDDDDDLDDDSFILIKLKFGISLENINTRILVYNYFFVISLQFNLFVFHLWLNFFFKNKKNIYIYYALTPGHPDIRQTRSCVYSIFDFSIFPPFHTIFLLDIRRGN